LIQAYETSSQRGVLARVLAFFKEAMGVDLESIERDELRFVVREKHQKGRDLGTYGMGMQRVFHIALRFASVAGGVLLLDDFETSLHAGVYAPLVCLLCDLAREFHVQVFLSTHSAEVVHAWTTPSLRSAVVGYGLRRVPGQETSEAVRFGGEKLHALHEAFGFDLRGVC
jgi:ABC-type phosphonate transport system ATPase subunit